MQRLKPIEDKTDEDTTDEDTTDEDNTDEDTTDEDTTDEDKTDDDTTDESNIKHRYFEQEVVSFNFERLSTKLAADLDASSEIVFLITPSILKQPYQWLDVLMSWRECFCEEEFIHPTIITVLGGRKNLRSLGKPSLLLRQEGFASVVAPVPAVGILGISFSRQQLSIRGLIMQSRIPPTASSTPGSQGSCNLGLTI
ncbi:hypothetical protein AVEN_116679-1 [Araneus ventricosus]|uniref:Uncharacterized protein n=1 Tax=Araneus ventricosus TaxID=182803 RepID=A0A4Y2L5G8_ARAVE|nr:hypothetical protein AVEN_116679-1 [Araneus ventricosus]